LSRLGVTLYSSPPSSSSGGGEKKEYLYDTSISTRAKFQEAAYPSLISPLAHGAIQGESTMAILGGANVGRMLPYLCSSQQNAVGLIVQAAEELLQSTYSEEDMTTRTGKVTFAWYKLDNSQNEVITDVLKSASSHANNGGSHGNTVNNSNNSTLVLREAGKGRGMIVPNVYEVELARGTDIEQVVAQVLQVIPHIADFTEQSSSTTTTNSSSSSVHSMSSTNTHNTHSGTAVAHTVFQLTVSNFEKIAEYNANHTLKLNSPSAHHNSSTDNPGIGRLSFLLLSPLQPTSSNKSGNQSTTSSTTAPIDGLTPFPNSCFSWVEHINQIMHWIATRLPSPPFHKCRLALLLKDVLLRRQRACMLHCLMASAESATHQQNVLWLRLFGLMNRDKEIWDRMSQQGMRGGGEQQGSRPNTPSRAAIVSEKASELRRVNSQTKLQHDREREAREKELQREVRERERERDEKERVVMERKMSGESLYSRERIDNPDRQRDQYAEEDEEEEEVFRVTDDELDIPYLTSHNRQPHHERDREKERQTVITNGKMREQTRGRYVQQEQEEYAQERDREYQDQEHERERIDRERESIITNSTFQGLSWSIRRRSAGHCHHWYNHHTYRYIQTFN
jgi:hypothetical protein